MLVCWQYLCLLPAGAMRRAQGYAGVAFPRRPVGLANGIRDFLCHVLLFLFYQASIA
jgi:hypothetical protein